MRTHHELEQYAAQRDIDTEEQQSTACSASPRPVSRTQLVLVLLLSVYSVSAFVLNFERAKVLFITELSFLLVLVFIKLWHHWALDRKVEAKVEAISNHRICRPKVVGSVVVAGMSVCLVVPVLTGPWSKVMSLVGLMLLIAGSWALSWHRHAVVWRPVIGGLALQLGFALLILKTSTGLCFRVLGFSYI